MFTGIVEEIGTITHIKNGVKSSKLIINCNKVLETTEIGDSICTNGVCLTVTNISKGTFEADVMAETIRKSNLNTLKIGSKVNLERALSLSTRLGGHLVSGHIDGIGYIKDLKKEDNAIWITIKTSVDILRYIVYKGSITIDGISLTIAYVDDDVFKVSIIPHTLQQTILSSKNIGDSVNLECDIIGKYVEKLLGISKPNKQQANNINETFLKENGFI
ncbi:MULTISPECIES: riboflavin synthase [Paraclostridium]|uniref:Riboflavin synthase n=1 Tax=Paraclostridium benzoelyticum TaxID=1629550 RepID=A0A0M3DEQ5_9FIRM|nr:MULTISPECIES: riboflavin synthase [Paraclostridium]KKX99866.1 riboflavin synthase subunit alpha [Paraclostridium benzoelyticum]MCU9816300.1 riboflavin synthase [Paraclostridium sp. AKS73]MDM8128214.1 riboflavin synthase [Paraclostridium benzoelyticum]OXX84406.1 riboflavin synthase subunit alpha [Paraclostridium benzoelyticum]